MSTMLHLDVLQDTLELDVELNYNPWSNVYHAAPRCITIKIRADNE